MQVNVLKTGLPDFVANTNRQLRFTKKVEQKLKVQKSRHAHALNHMNDPRTNYSTISNFPMQCHVRTTHRREHQSAGDEALITNHDNANVLHAKRHTYRVSTENTAKIP